ncbi:MAG: hypothetical protein WKF58_02115 [Ilumatobacteraceae bacterium]
MVRSPRPHVPLVALAVGTGLMVGTHLRMVDRYYLQITPWVLMYATYAVIVVSGTWRSGGFAVARSSVSSALRLHAPASVALVPSAASRLDR